MLLNLSTLSADELAIANTPELGAESVVKVTGDEFEQLFTVQNTTDSAADIAAISGVTFPLVLSENRHLHLRADVSCPYDTDMIVEATVVFADDSTGTIRATLKVPSWADQTIKNVPIGAAVDFKLTDGNPLAQKVKSITSIDTISGGKSGVLNRFSIWTSPDVGDFADVGCTRSKSFEFQLPSSVSVPCGYEASKFVKKGRSEEVELELEFVHFSSFSSLQRLNGGRCSLMINVIKDDTVPWETVILTGHRPNASPNRGDGDDEVLATSSGPYESFLLFSVE